METSPSLAVFCFFVRMNLYFSIIRVLMVWVHVLRIFRQVLETVWFCVQLEH